MRCPLSFLGGQHKKRKNEWASKNLAKREHRSRRSDGNEKVKKRGKNAGGVWEKGVGPVKIERAQGRLLFLLAFFFLEEKEKEGELNGIRVGWGDASLKSYQILFFSSSCIHFCANVLRQVVD